MVLQPLYLHKIQWSPTKTKVKKKKKKRGMLKNEGK